MSGWVEVWWQAVDDFTVVWPGASRVERLLAGLAAIPGVQVDGVWKAIGAPVSGGHDAELLAQVAANPADGLATLVDAVPGLLAADWAAAAVVPADWAARTGAPRPLPADEFLQPVMLGDLGRGFLDADLGAEVDPQLEGRFPGLGKDLGLDEAGVSAVDHADAGE